MDAFFLWPDRVAMDVLRALSGHCAIKPVTDTRVSPLSRVRGSMRVGELLGRQRSVP